MAENKGKTQSLLNGAFILVAATVLVKVIGALFKIPLSMLIGEVGRGYFNAAYEIYNPLYSISMAGLPVAVSRMVAAENTLGRYRDVRLIKNVAFRIFLITGAVGTALMFAIAYPYSRFIVHATENVFSILAIAPSIFFCCCMSTYRGYYEGLQNMIPTAVSEVVEASSKLVFGLGGTYFFLKVMLSRFENGQPVFGQVYDNKNEVLACLYPYAAATAIFGVTLGTILGLLFLVIRNRRIGDGINSVMLKESREPDTGHNIMTTLIKTALPVAAASLVLNITNLIDSTTILNRLAYAMRIAPDVIKTMYASQLAESGTTDSQIVQYLYGVYGEVLDFKNLVPTVTLSLGISAIPIISAAWARKDSKTIKVTVESAIRVTMLAALPIGFGLSAVAYYLLNTFYPQASASIGAPILTIYGFAIFIFSVSSPITNMLQALGRMDIPLKALCVGATVKIILNYILVGNPHINIIGATVGSVVCYVIVVIINLIAIIKITDVRINFASCFFKPLLCSGLSFAAAFASVRVFAKLLSGVGDPDAVVNGNSIAVVIAVIAAVIAYVIPLLLVKGISADDLEMIPKGEKIAERLEKYGFLG